MLNRTEICSHKENSEMVLCASSIVIAIGQDTAIQAVLASSFTPEEIATGGSTDHFEAFSRQRIGQHGMAVWWVDNVDQTTANFLFMLTNQLHVRVYVIVSPTSVSVSLKFINQVQKHREHQVLTLQHLGSGERLVLTRQRVASDLRDDSGPFDLVGDVHGCYDEMEDLLQAMGYKFDVTEAGRCAYHPQARRLIFLGDLVDRGPRNLDVLKLVMRTCKAGNAYCIKGNHEASTVRAIASQAGNATPVHGSAQTLSELAQLDHTEREQLSKFLTSLPSHLWIDGGRLCAVHAGIDKSMLGRQTRKVDEFCQHARRGWVDRYTGSTSVVYGHAPNAKAAWEGKTLCIDTGCVFGGRLTAYRYPEHVICSVPALKSYAMTEAM